jgi:hypothetical protein
MADNILRLAALYNQLAWAGYGRAEFGRSYLTADLGSRGRFLVIHRFDVALVFSP